MAKLTSSLLVAVAIQECPKRLYGSDGYGRDELQELHDETWGPHCRARFKRGVLLSADEVNWGAAERAV